MRAESISRQHRQTSGMPIPRLDSQSMNPPPSTTVLSTYVYVWSKSQVINSLCLVTHIHSLRPVSLITCKCAHIGRVSAQPFANIVIAPLDTCCAMLRLRGDDRSPSATYQIY